jgi:hypothetical protein
MRALKIASGIAVLLTALHFSHAIHHFYVFSPTHSPGVWAGVILAVIVDLLTFIGGVCLLMRGFR